MSPAREGEREVRQNRCEQQGGQDHDEVSTRLGPSAEREGRKDTGERGVYMHDEHTVGALAATLDPSRTK